MPNHHSVDPIGSDHIQALASYQAAEPEAPRDLVERAQSIQVVDLESANRAADLRAEIAGARKQIEQSIEPHKKNAHKTWRALCDEESRQTKPYMTLEMTLSTRITAWQDEEQRRQREAARAELARAEAEAKAERERRAADLREQGLSKTAALAEARQDVQTTLYERQVAVASAAAPTIKGTSHRKTWVGSVTDLKALCAEIAAGRAPVHLIQIAQAELNRLAAATRGPSPIKGVIFTETSANVRAGGRR